MSTNDRDIIKLKGAGNKADVCLEADQTGQAIRDKAGRDDNLIQSISINGPVVEALLVVRIDWLKAIPANGKADRLTQTIENACPTIWKTVNLGSPHDLSKIVG
ncbi:MAG TPA: hypothetical protein VGM32_19575 [Rhodopila sp.]|jgi:hypothetical protein